MKLGAFLIVAILISAVGTHFLMQDPGYVVINFRGWIIEMSVPGLLLILTLVAITAWVILWLLRAPRKLGEAAAAYSGRRAGKRFTQGLIEIAEGNYAKGEKLLTRGAGKADAPLLNYLAAARAAQLQNQDARRDNWLALAYEQQPEASNAILLTQAELQIGHEQYELALATLKKLDEQEAGNGQAVVLLAKLYRRLDDWRALGELLPRLRRIGKPDRETIDHWTIEFYAHRLQETGGYNGDVGREWGEVPKALRKNTTLQIAYIEALLATEQGALAERELRTLLKGNWHPRLVALYGESQGEDPAAQLQQAEKWLGKRPDDAALLLSAGRLCMTNKLWGKARSYLESSLAAEPSPTTYATYGELLGQLGESAASAAAYRKGLTIVVDEVPALPDPNQSES
ncbi:MAG: heme biosynthesis HemY N-terminal domain-containing protein [Pseudomonadota bacterium]